MCDLHNKNEPNTRELLEGLPKNWGKWGPDDEVGAEGDVTLLHLEGVAGAHVEAVPGRQAEVVGRVGVLAAGAQHPTVHRHALQARYIPVHAGIQLEARYADGTIAVVGAVLGAVDFGVDDGRTAQQAQAGNRFAEHVELHAFVDLLALANIGGA